MQAKIEKYHLTAMVDSAGFEHFHTGDPPDYRAVKIMKLHGLDISHQRARLFRVDDFSTFDRIYVMDKWNYADVQAVATNKDQIRKVDFVLNAINPKLNKPVPDPYSGGLNDFETTYRLLDEATEYIAKDLKSGG